MTLFDDNVADVLAYSSTVQDLELRHAILVGLVKAQARHRGVDLIATFYSNPYGGEALRDEKEACNYLMAIHMLRELYDVALARGVIDSTRLDGKPTADEAKKIREKIENI